MTTVDARPTPSLALASTQAANTRDSVRSSALVVFGENIALFLAGVLLMYFFFARAPVADGMPGHDSFYHLQMARMLSDEGLVKTFPWLQYAYFMDEGDGFVSHHYGFHAVLNGILQVSRVFFAEDMAGGRLAVAIFLGLNLVLVNALLTHARVRWRFFWLALFLFLPHQFFLRHAYVRAIGPSAVFLLLITLLVFRQRYLLVGLAVTAFIHLYLGGVMYAPVLVGSAVAAMILAPSIDRRIPYKLVVFALAGWGLGVLTYPYREGMFEFLKMQVFGTGLSPDIPVGREWKAYSDVWWFATTLSGASLGTFGVSLCLRLRWGPRIDAEESTLLFLNLGFLVLTLKARRFIEYWPLFCLLSTAYLFRPVEAVLDERIRSWFASHRTRGTIIAVVMPVMLIAIGVFALSQATRIPASSTLIWVTVSLGAVALALRPVVHAHSLRPRLLTAATAAVGVVLVSSAALAFNGQSLSSVQNAVRCKYDVRAVNALMDHLKSVSQPGEIIFTDDWDIFPLYFYFNNHNHYIVGLDPKFTHTRRPDLWERFVRITQGDTPSSRRVRMTDGKGGSEWRTVRTDLSDIRDEFGASYVITDRDHKGLASALDQSPEFATMIYPEQTEDQSREPFLLWKILDGEPGRSRKTSRPSSGNPNIVYLSELTPKEGAEEDFYIFDQSFGGEPISVGRFKHLRGVVMLADSTLTFEVPEGFSHFEATAIVGDVEAACGELTAIVRTERGPMATIEPDKSEPARIRVDVSPGSTVSLVSTGRRTGQRCIVSWGSARFVR